MYRHRFWLAICFVVLSLPEIAVSQLVPEQVPVFQLRARVVTVKQAETGRRSVSLHSVLATERNLRRLPAGNGLNGSHSTAPKSKPT